MTLPLVLRQRSGPVCATLALLGVAASAAGADTFNAATGHLTIPTLTIGNATYSNVIVTIGTLLEPPAGTVPAFPADSYFPGSNELTVQTVGVVGGQTYDNVVVTVAALDSVGNAAGVDTYHDGILTLPEVQAGSDIYQCLPGGGRCCRGGRGGRHAEDIP